MAAPIYVTVASLKNLSAMPDEFIVELETRYPTFLTTQISYWSRWLDTQLRKRYRAPFNAITDDPQTPMSVQGWVARIVTMWAWMKRGVDANDQQLSELIKDDYDSALAEIKEAANSENSWFDLPLRDDNDESAISKTGPKSYVEVGAYTWTDVQREEVADEDINRRGRFRG